MLALASFVRRAPDGGQGGGNVVTVPGSDGWMTLHASLPGPPGDGRVAVVLERAGGARSATVRLEAFGATAREREVATLLARGLSRAEMAEALVLSPHTVEDHVKSLYEKLGVASRQELVARVFLDEYLPEVARQTPLTSRGRFDRARSARRSAAAGSESDSPGRHAMITAMLRRATPADRPALVALALAEDAAWSGAPAVSVEEVGEHIDSFEPGVIFERDGRVAGYAAAGEGGRTILLVDPGDDPEPALEALVAWLGERGHHEVDSYGRDARRIAWLEAHGFTHRRSFFDLQRGIDPPLAPAVMAERGRDRALPARRG